MAELHIDDDWKKQAQAEKKKLIEQEQQARPVAPAGAVSHAGTAAVGAVPGAAAGPGGRDARQAPQASMATVVNSFMTQALYHLGDIAARGMQPTINLDMAKLQIDSLGVLEEKTKGNLTPEEQKLLDGALYEVRMRFIDVASRYAELP
jgi:hypothetical protein